MNIIDINEITDERLSVYTKYNEAQLLHFYEPNGGLFIAETPVVIERALAMGATPLSFLIEDTALENVNVKTLLDSVDKYEPEIYVARHESLNKITGYNLTRGVLSAMRRPSQIPVEELLGKTRRIAILEDVMNPTNVGAIFRSAAALGVDAVFLTRGCADPFYRRAARVSMGTVFQVPWTYFGKNEDYMKTVHENGFKTVAMALTDDAIALNDNRLKGHEKLAVIFGTESTGIKEDTLMKSDFVSIIPMHNDVDSLNVAAASAVAFWELAGK